MIEQYHLINQLRTRQENVYGVDTKDLFLSQQLMNELKQAAVKNNSSHARICLHQSDKSELHTMLVYQSTQFKGPIHAHPVNIENLTLLRGIAKVEIFNHNIKLQSSTLIKGCMNQDSSISNLFFYQVAPMKFHRLEIIEEIFYIENTLGPFIKGKSMIIADPIN
tara:strand:- start:739 stop:1233 length:495 start_codon:yes stop_codon:yes gene_type:complete